MKPKRRMILFSLFLLLLLLLLNRTRTSYGGLQDEGGSPHIRITSNHDLEKTSASTKTQKPSFPRFQYKHSTSPFAVDSGGYAFFGIDHGLQELSWEESTRLNSWASQCRLRGKVTLYVVDPDGNPISGANIHSRFVLSDNKVIPDTEYDALTDENGLATFEGRTTDYVYFDVTQEGYYPTKHIYNFLVRKHKCSKGNHWIPWNPILEVTLKPIRNPEKRRLRYANIVFPSRNEPYGFDCEVGDLVEPFGTGKVSDFLITFFSDATPEAVKNYCFTNEVQFLSQSSEEAFLVRPLDQFSQFPYVYEAPEEGYTEKLFFSRRLSGPAASLVCTINPLLEANYILLRLREQHNEDGSLLSAQYGKIVSRDFAMKYSPKKDTLKLSFFYYLNPTVNDRNMEGEDDYW